MTQDKQKMYFADLTTLANSAKACAEYYEKVEQLFRELKPKMKGLASHMEATFADMRGVFTVLSAEVQDLVKHTNKIISKPFYQLYEKFAVILEFSIGSCFFEKYFDEKSKAGEFDVIILELLTLNPLNLKNKM